MSDVEEALGLADHREADGRQREDAPGDNAEK